MNEPYTVLRFYPEQKKSLCKLMAEAVRSGFLFEKEYNETFENASRLKTVVEKNMQFLINTLLIKDYSEPLSVVAEFNLLYVVLLDDDFLWLLAKNSLTNRIINGCEKQKLSESVICRIRECVTAFVLLTADYDF